MEPMSVAQKAIEQAYRIQQRLRVWKPKRAAVLGSGTLGLLATLVLRLRGVEVTSFGNTMPPFLNSTLIEEIGAPVRQHERTLADPCFLKMRTLRFNSRRHWILTSRL